MLTGDEEATAGRPDGNALLIQNTNPVCVAPEQNAVKQGFARDDLFTVVHEQFMTETAKLADVVLPATMFMEHDDIYRGGGHQHIILGPKLVDGPGETRANHFVIEELAERLGVGHMPGFGQTENELIDDLLKSAGRGSLADVRGDRWIDCQPSFDESHYLNGFSHSDGKFHFKADWSVGQTFRPPETMGLQGPHKEAPQLPDHWEIIEQVDDAHPYRLATPPARSFLNSTFNRTPVSVKREGRPTVMIHPLDAEAEGIADGERVRLKNQRGVIIIHVEFFDGIKRGVLITEGIFPNDAHEDGCGINTLTSAVSIAPHGGAPFHDTKVAIERIR